MYQRVCRCPLCQLEKRIISILELEDSAQWFLNLAAGITSLNAFERAPDLISYVHTAGQPGNKRPHYVAEGSCDLVGNRPSYLR